jgi:signal transduction histidine kinase
MARYLARRERPLDSWTLAGSCERFRRAFTGGWRQYRHHGAQTSRGRSQGDSSTSLIRDAAGVPQYFVGEVLDITKRKQAEAALSDMTRKLVEAQELERARIARELHDGINQRLAVLAIEVDRLRERDDLPREVQGNLLELQNLTGDISSRVYALSHELHSSTLDALGLARGMKGWCKEFGAGQGMEYISQRSGSRKLLSRLLFGFLFGWRNDLQFQVLQQLLFALIFK